MPPVMPRYTHLLADDEIGETSNLRGGKPCGVKGNRPIG